MNRMGQFADAPSSQRLAGATSQSAIAEAIFPIAFGLIAYSNLGSQSGGKNGLGSTVPLLVCDAGIGRQLRMDGDTLLFVPAMPAPAAEAGLQAGTILLIFIDLWWRRAVSNCLPAILFIGTIPTHRFATTEIIFSRFCAKGLRQIALEYCG